MQAFARVRTHHGGIQLLRTRALRATHTLTVIFSENMKVTLSVSPVSWNDEWRSGILRQPCTTAATVAGVVPAAPGVFSFGPLPKAAVGFGQGRVFSLKLGNSGGKPVFF